MAQIERGERAGVLLDQVVRREHAKGKLNTKLGQVLGFIGRVLSGAGAASAVASAARNAMRHWDGQRHGAGAAVRYEGGQRHGATASLSGGEQEQRVLSGAGAVSAVAGAARNAVQYWDGQRHGAGAAVRYEGGQRHGATASLSGGVQGVLSGTGAVSAVASVVRAAMRDWGGQRHGAGAVSAVAGTVRAAVSVGLQRLLLLGMVSAGLTLSTGCSSKPDLPEAEVVVKDPISFDVKGLEGEIESNVEAHLNALAVISKERVRFYMREIEDTGTAALRAFGYYHPKIEVELPDPDNAEDRTVVVNVDAGKPLYIRNYVLQILGEGSRYKIFEDIIKENSLNTYHPLNHGQYEQLKQKLHEQAMSLGFFDGKFISSRILVYQDQNMADIEIIYDSGPRYRFGKLVLDEESERLLRPSKSLQPWQDGDYYAASKISSFIQSLNQTNYYNIVDVRPLIDERADQETPIAVHLERRANNNVRLGIGYSTDEGPRLMVEWNKPLLNDRGDSFSSLMTLTPVTQEAQFIYKIPRKDPNLNYYTLNASQEHIDLNDTEANRSQLAVHYIANDQGKWRQDYALRLEYEDFNQGGEEGYALNLLPAVRFSRRESSGGFDPAKGYSLTLEALGASETVVSDNTFAQFKATYRGVMSPTPTTRFVFRLEQGANFGPDAETVPPSFRFFAGGDNSIRGFGYRDKAPTQPFGSGLKGARYMTTGTAEYQFPIGVANSRLALFVDGGVVTDDYSSDWNMLWGPGLGYRYISPYGTVRVDLATGMESGQDRSYQLHFAFGPEF